jgi:triosephosphate isomerase
MVRKLIVELYNSETSELTKILYGGSVNLQNINEIMSIKEIDGVGISRASLDPENFIKTIRIVSAEAEIRH